MEKKNIVISILLTIVLIALALTAGYLIGNNTNKTEKKTYKTEEKENTKEEKTYKIEDANKLVEKYYKLINYAVNYADDKKDQSIYSIINESIKNYLALDSLNIYYYNNETLASNYEIKTCGDLFIDHPTNTIEGIGVNEDSRSYYIGHNACSYEDELAYVSYDIANIKYKELFGKKKNMQKINAENMHDVYAYSSYYNGFAYGFQLQSSGSNIKPIIGKTIDAKIENNELVINYQYFNVTYLRDENGDLYLATINGKNKITEDELKNKSSLFDKYKEQENIYNLKITFINEDNNYVIKDIYKTSI